MRFSDERLQLLIILAAGFILRLLILLTFSAIEVDGTAYAVVADQFSKGLFAQGLGNIFSPMYPVFVALFHLLIPDVELAARLVSLICGTVLIYVCFLFAKRLLGDVRKAVWVAFLVAFQPHLVSYSGQVLSESFTTLVFVLSVFAFYMGWHENRRAMIAFSGLFLVLAYLARPEYLVYYAPFVLLLLPGKRFKDIGILLLPVCILGLLYILYLHLTTGQWMISNKMNGSPIAPPSWFFTRFPQVVYNLGSAIFPPFLLLAAFGFAKTEGRYRNLVVVLSLFHVFSLSFVGHSTKRYSVEFIPLYMFFAAEGVPLVLRYLRRLSPRYLGVCLILVVITLSGVLQAYSPPRRDRALHKEAGRYLKNVDPGSVIASRLPMVPFYAEGRAVVLRGTIERGLTADQFNKIIDEEQVKYIAIDEQMERDLSYLKDYTAGLRLLKEFRDGDYFVRVYRIDGKKKEAQSILSPPFILSSNFAV